MDVSRTNKRFSQVVSAKPFVEFCRILSHIILSVIYLWSKKWSERSSDCLWEGRYRIISADGEKHYRSVYGKSYTEVKEKLADKIRMANIPGLLEEAIVNDIRFCLLVEEWLKEIEKNRKYSTYVKYRTLYQCHIQKLFSDDLFTDMTNSYIQDRIAALEVSDSSKHSMLAVIKQTLRYAEKQYGYPMPSIVNSSLRSRAHSIEIMDRTEQARLMQFLHKDMDISKAGIFLCLSTGLRLGEICSLKWIDIDSERRLLHVSRTVQRIKSKEGPAKTILLETSPNSVFSRPMEPRTYQNHFKRYLGNIKAPDYNFHTLRHTFATNCIDSGMDIKSLSEILGHSNVQITLDRYVHPSMDTKRKYINALSADYGQLCGQPRKK